MEREGAMVHTKKGEEQRGIEKRELSKVWGKRKKANSSSLKAIVPQVSCGSG